MTGLLHLAAAIDAHPQAVRAVATAVVLISCASVTGMSIIDAVDRRRRAATDHFHRCVVLPFDRRAARQRRRA